MFCGRFELVMCLIHGTSSESGIWQRGWSRMLGLGAEGAPWPRSRRAARCRWSTRTPRAGGPRGVGAAEIGGVRDDHYVAAAVTCTWGARQVAGDLEGGSGTARRRRAARCWGGDPRWPRAVQPGAGARRAGALRRPRRRSAAPRRSNRWARRWRARWRRGRGASSRCVCGGWAGRRARPVRRRASAQQGAPESAAMARAHRGSSR